MLHLLGSPARALDGGSIETKLPTVRDWFKPTTETGAKVYLAALVVLFVGAVAFMIFYGVDFRKLGRD